MCDSGKIISFPQDAYYLAKRFLCRRNRANHLRQRLYFCHECGEWHLTSQPQHVSYRREDDELSLSGSD